jgi:hypothetical protein
MRCRILERAELGECNMVVLSSFLRALTETFQIPAPFLPADQPFF